MKWKEAFTQQKNTSMLIWFWMILLVLREGFGIDQPYKEVNDTTTCQEIIKVTGYQTRLPCTGKDVRYHCLLDGNSTKEYEVCREWKWIPKGKCAYFNTYGSGNVDERDCESTPGLPCAVKEYNSADNTQYAACYVKKEMTTVPILETRVVNSSNGENSSLGQTPPTNSIQDKQSHPGSALGIAFGVLIPLILAVAAAVLLIKYGKILEHCRKGSKEKTADIEGQSHEEEKLLETKEEEKKDLGNENNDERNSERLTPIHTNIPEAIPLNSTENNAGNQQRESENDATINSTTQGEGELKPSDESSSEDNIRDTKLDDGSEGNCHPQAEETVNNRNKAKEVIEMKEEANKNIVQKDSENGENRIKMHDNMFSKEPACCKTENENLKEIKNQLSSMHGKDSSAQSLEETKETKIDSPSQHADETVKSEKKKLNDSEANDAEDIAIGKGATGEAKSKDKTSAENDRRGSLCVEQELPGKGEESVSDIEKSTCKKGVSEEAGDEKDGSTGEEKPTNTSDEYKTKSASENIKGPVQSLDEDEPTDVFGDTVESLQRESVDRKDVEYCQELYDFLNKVFTNPARTLFKSVLSKNVEKSPAEILKDASIQTELREELPQEYHASISPEGEDNESVIILNCLLRKYLKETESPKSGWGKPVKNTDKGIGDDVERLCRVYTIIREISDPGKISVENYERLLYVVFDAFKRLDANEKFKDDHNKLIKKLQDIRNLHRSQQSNAFVLQ